MKTKKTLLFIITTFAFHVINAQNIIVQRDSGTSPMGVHLKVNESNWEDWTQNDYEWTFPDGEIKIGPQVAHTIKNQGWIHLKITTPANTSIVDSFFMEIFQPEDVFSSSFTYYLSSSGNFEGAPSTANHLNIYNLSDIEFLPNRQYLFRKDDSFLVNSSMTIPSNTYLSDYGEGTNLPNLKIDGDANTTTFWLGSNVTICNLSFEGIEWVPTSTFGEELYGEGKLFAPNHHTTLYNLTIRNMTYVTVLEDGSGAINNIILDQIDATNLGSYFLYSGPSPSMQNSAVLNSTISNVISNHGIRMNGGQYFLVNNVQIDSVARSHITFRGLKHGSISDSKFTGKGLYKNSIRNIYDDAALTDSVKYIIIERNQYASRNNEFGIDLNIGEDIVIRNNLLINSSLNIGENLSGIIPQNVKILHNTFYQNNYDWYSMITLRVGGSGDLLGNVIYNDGCESYDCKQSTPFPTYSVNVDNDWQLNYNLYYESSDPEGEIFKGSFSWEDWVAMGNDSQSLYQNIDFINKSSILGLADFKPVNSEEIKLSPINIHRDHYGNRRLYSSLYVSGAFDNNPTTAMPIDQKPISFDIFPNPSSNIINVKFPQNLDNKKITVSIYNTLGQKIILKNNVFKDCVINIEHLPPGKYVAVFSDNSTKLGTCSFIKL